MFVTEYDTICCSNVIQFFSKQNTIVFVFQQVAGEAECTSWIRCCSQWSCSGQLKHVPIPRKASRDKEDTLVYMDCWCMCVFAKFKDNNNNHSSSRTKNALGAHVHNCILPWQGPSAIFLLELVTIWRMSYFSNGIVNIPLHKISFSWKSTRFASAADLSYLMFYWLFHCFQLLGNLICCSMLTFNRSAFTFLEFCRIW